MLRLLLLPTTAASPLTRRHVSGRLRRFVRAWPPFPGRYQELLVEVKTQAVQEAETAVLTIVRVSPDELGYRPVALLKGLGQVGRAWRARGRPAVRTHSYVVVGCVRCSSGDCSIRGSVCLSALRVSCAPCNFSKRPVFSCTGLLICVRVSSHAGCLAQCVAGASCNAMTDLCMCP